MTSSIRQSKSDRRELIVATLVGLLVGLILMAPKLTELLPTKWKQTYFFATRFKGQPIEAGPLTKICDAIRDGAQLVIRLSGTLDDLRNYQNLMQTADQNGGIRIEIDQSGSIALLIADRSELTFLAVPATGTVVPGRFRATVNVMDGKNVSFQVGTSLATGRSETLQPSCSKIVVGYGYDSSRTTAGRYRAEFSVLEKQHKFISPAVQRGLKNEFLRSLALGVLVFCVILVALNLSNAVPQRSTTNTLEGDDEDSREGQGGPPAGE